MNVMDLITEAKKTEQIYYKTTQSQLLSCCYPWEVVTRLPFLLWNWSRKSCYIHATWDWQLPRKRPWTAVVETCLFKPCFFPSCRINATYKLPATAGFSWCSWGALHFSDIDVQLRTAFIYMCAEFQLPHFSCEEDIFRPFTIIKHWPWRGWLALHLSFSHIITWKINPDRKSDLPNHEISPAKPPSFMDSLIISQSSCIFLEGRRTVSLAGILSKYSKWGMNFFTSAL